MDDDTDSDEKKTTLLRSVKRTCVSLVPTARYNGSAWAEVLRCDELHDQ